MPMHFLTYLAHPTESAKEFADSGGAYVNCWILNDSRQAAEEMAISMIDEYGWAVDALEDAGTVTSDDYAEDDEGLLQRESGDFTWRGATRPAERTLRFLRGPDGTADVRFADGRFFHGLDLRSGRHIADHPCSADLYRGDFTVRDADHWRVVWRVRGPAKDLELVTEYARTPVA